MKQTMSLCVSLILLIISAIIFPNHLYAKESLPSSATIGFIPGEDPEGLKRNGVELAKYLQNKLEVPINIYISKDYNSLVDAMKEKKIDFAFFSAVTFVDAEKRAGAKILLKKVWGGPFYYSAIVTLNKNKVKTVGDLKGSRFGFVDEKSASGYLYPMVYFSKKKIDTKSFFKETKFFGQHEASLKALLNGEVDAVAVFSDDAKGSSGAWSKFLAERKSEFKVLWVSDPIPNDPFAVRQDFYDSHPRFTHDLMFSLIDMRDEPADKNILKKLYGIDSLELATSKQYDPVRELVKTLNSKQRP